MAMLKSAKLSPRPPDETDYKPTDNDLVLGDPHGSLDAVQRALKAANWKPDKQQVISLGDNCDKGGQSRELAEFMDHYGMKSILGNHCWKHARNAAHMLTAAATGKKNPIKQDPELTDTIQQFGDTYIKHATKMGKYPIYLPFHDAQGAGNLVHGGLEPDIPINEQSKDSIMVRRFHPSPNEFRAEETPEFPLWQRSYKGDNGTILHGHHPMASPQGSHGNPHVYSLDQGSVGGSMHPWGGGQSIMRLGDRKVFTVPGDPQAEAHYREIIAKKKALH